MSIIEPIVTATSPPDHSIRRAFIGKDPDAIVEIPIIEYLMHCHSQRCKHCGRRERWSVLYEVRVVKAPLTGSVKRLLRPVSAAIDPALPLRYSNLVERTILRCGSCIPFEPSTPHIRAPIDEAAWAETVARKATTEKPAILVAEPASSKMNGGVRKTTAALLSEL